MAQQNNFPISHATAKRQLNALVRKFNQASTNIKGNELDIMFDEDQIPDSITYTLIMKHPSKPAWEVRRVTTELHMDLQYDYITMVQYMDERLHNV